MAEILTNKEHLKKFGFCVVRNLLDNKEIKKYRSVTSKINKKNGGSTQGSRIMEMIRNRETWEYIMNDRLLNILRSLLGPNIFWLHDMSTRHQVKNDITAHQFTWHRDNPCRRIGKGPDWDQDEPYNVVGAITYLTSHEDSGSGVNFIPSSHKKTYTFTISNILRLMHYRTRNIKFLQGLRNIIQKNIGVACRTDPGDCVIFFANLFHEPLPTRGTRQAIMGRFGPEGKHSKNYVNYHLKHRKGNDYEINDSNKTTIDDFFNLLKSKNIYFPLPEKKEKIEGVTIPKSEY